MAKCGYSVVTTAAVAVTTAKTILGVKSGAAFGVDLQYASVTCDGVTASAVPGLIELVYVTWATNAPGTNSTSRTPAQLYGRVIAHGVTAASAWTTEPTVVTVLDEKLLSPNGGMVVEFEPLGTTWDCALGEGFGIRATFAATVNLRCGLRWERC